MSYRIQLQHTRMFNLLRKISQPFVALLLVLSLSVGTVYAQKAGQECFPKKQTDRMVYDNANVLSASEQESLEQRLRQFVISTSNEITVVIVPDLCGMEKAQFAIELGELWQVGQAKEDNGVVVLVKPKTPDSKGEVFIATGRGLEGAIPDATAHLIVENEMIPSFRANDMAGGINKGVTTLMELAKGDYNSEAYAERYKNHSSEMPVWSVILMVLVIIGLIMLFKVLQVRNYARLNNIGFWAAWALLNSMNSTHSGSWRNFNSGGGGFGGGGGGGFGGFGGGGSFGGGGAGGSW